MPNSSAVASSSRVGQFFRERTLSINKHYLFVNKDKLLFAKIAPEERAPRAFAEKIAVV